MHEIRHPYPPKETHPIKNVGKLKEIREPAHEKNAYEDDAKKR
jgi:hypothetical protein